ncbi:MAG: patatin-like phospholipase family protein [Wenzhouxiangellaceae bacterium]
MSGTRNTLQTAGGEKSVALVLGAGGARGLAHIGAIRAIEAQGFRIKAIAGSSMGALIGGLHAAGRLDSYADWVCGLQQSDVLRLVDWTLTGGGLIRGDRIIEHLREMVGEFMIEDLPIDFTAVTVDLDQGRELWITHGPLFEAIRASIAIPGLFTPHRHLRRTLVDGGLLNPVPVAPTLRTLTDLTFVVNVNGPVGRHRRATNKAPVVETSDDDQGMLERLRRFFNGLVDRDETRNGDGDPDPSPGLVAVLVKSLEVMQSAITRQNLAVFRPDLVVEIPRDCAMIHEFHRAAELIELGHERTMQALKSIQAARDE